MGRHASASRGTAQVDDEDDTDNHEDTETEDGGKEEKDGPGDDEVIVLSGNRTGHDSSKPQKKARMPGKDLKYVQPVIIIHLLVVCRV